MRTHLCEFQQHRLATKLCGRQLQLLSTWNSISIRKAHGMPVYVQLHDLGSVILGSRDCDGMDAHLLAEVQIDQQLLVGVGSQEQAVIFAIALLERICQRVARLLVETLAACEIDVFKQILDTGRRCHGGRRAEAGAQCALISSTQQQ
jgi:hypothetical protein